MNINLFKEELTSVGFTNDELNKVETEGDSVILKIISDKINDLIEDQTQCENNIAHADEKFTEKSKELAIKKRTLEKNRELQRRLSPRALPEVPQTEERYRHLIKTYEGDIETSKAQLTKKLPKEKKKYYTDLMERRKTEIEQLKMSWELPKAAEKLEESIRQLENEVDKWKSEGKYVRYHKQMLAKDDEKLQKINLLREQIVKLVDQNEPDLKPIGTPSSETSDDRRTGSLSSSTVEPYDISSDASQNDIDQFVGQYSNFLEGLEEQLDNILNDDDPSTQTILADSLRDDLNEYLQNRKKFGIEEPPEAYFQGILDKLSKVHDLEEDSSLTEDPFIDVSDESPLTVDEALSFFTDKGEKMRGIERYNEGLRDLTNSFNIITDHQELVFNIKAVINYMQSFLGKEEQTGIDEELKGKIEGEIEHYSHSLEEAEAALQKEKASINSNIQELLDKVELSDDGGIKNTPQSESILYNTLTESLKLVDSETYNNLSPEQKIKFGAFILEKLKNAPSIYNLSKVDSQIYDRFLPEQKKAFKALFFNKIKAFKARLFNKLKEETGETPIKEILDKLSKVHDLVEDSSLTEDPFLDASDESPSTVDETQSFFTDKGEKMRDIERYNEGLRDLTNSFNITTHHQELVFNIKAVINYMQSFLEKEEQIGIDEELKGKIEGEIEYYSHSLEEAEAALQKEKAFINSNIQELLDKVELSDDGGIKNTPQSKSILYYTLTESLKLVDSETYNNLSSEQKKKFGAFIIQKLKNAPSIHNLSKVDSQIYDRFLPEQKIAFTALFFNKLKEKTDKIPITYASRNVADHNFSDISLVEATAVKVAGGRLLHGNKVKLEYKDKDLGAKIATQHPYMSERAIQEFWESAFNVGVIIDLNTPDAYPDGDVEPLKFYFPKGDEKVKQCGPFKIEVEKIDVGENYDIQYFKVSKEGEDSPRQVSRIHFKKWVDFAGLADNPELLEELYLAEKSLIKERNFETDTDSQVHCRAGVGRTGTYVVYSAMSKLAEDPDGLTNLNLVDVIHDLTLSLRKQRGPIAVQSPPQLQTLLQAGFALQKKKPA